MAITKVYVENNEWLAPSAAASFRRVRAAGALGRLVDAGRTYWEQLALWLKGNGLAAKPNSTAAKHQLGLAIDVNTTFAAWLHKWGAAYGWIATLDYEWWHFEYFANLDTFRFAVIENAIVENNEDEDTMFEKLNALYIRHLGRGIDAVGYVTRSTEIITGRSSFAQQETALKGSPEGLAFAKKTEAQKHAAWAAANWNVNAR